LLVGVRQVTLTLNISFKNSPGAEDSQTAKNTAKSPVKRPPPVTISNLVVADLEADGEALDVEAEAEDGVEVALPVEDGDEEPLSAASIAGSEINEAETPDELVQEEGGVPVPVTKFTIIHFSIVRKYITHKSGLENVNCIPGNEHHLQRPGLSVTSR